MVIIDDDYWVTGEGAFERRYMNLAVQRAWHPGLREYIHSSINGLLPFIQKGQVERVAVFFFSTENIPVERFIFKLALNQSYDREVEDSDLEYPLRSFLLKLSVSKPLTMVLPHDSRSEITGYFRSVPEMGISRDVELWIPTDTKQWQQPSLITPIKSISCEPVCVQLYVEHPSFSKQRL